ncbi:RNA-directed DNA polymerase from mobile element jockey [Eumeta japonica]|uniref:RNA-directed DNA polymerase from mobile element jockey n=1 Tax=Eumeta variegata TaxID=151549 RepID=A0A4C1UCW0_EUMVA|nr:RNA-directed DNA polymerase from mobile element jockey [Eumeta japonica]
MGPPDGGRPIPIRKITNWKECRPRLRKSTLQTSIAFPMTSRLQTRLTCHRCFTNHVRTVVEESEREVPASSDRRKFPPDILELIRAKTQLCAARAYPTPEYRSRARALQREVKARVREFRNESWSDLMEEIKPSHKAFWAVTKALKTEGYTPIPPLKKPDNSVAIDDAEIAECLADSIETQCSHAFPPHDIVHISRIEEEASTSQGNHATSCQLQTDQPPERSGQTIRKILKTRLSDHLLGKGLIIDEQFGFRPAHSCPQQVLRLVEYVSEGFETERSTVAVFDVAKAFDRQTDISHLGMSALTRQDVLSEQEFLKAPPSPSAVLAYTNDVPRPSSSGVQLALFADDTALFTEIGIGAPDSPSSLQRAIDELGQWFRKWRIEVNPTNQQPYNSSMVRLESTHCRQNTPNLKMLDAIIPWQRNYKYLGVTLDKNLHFRDHIERVRNTALFYKARLGAVLGRKSKLSRRNKRTIYKMCIRTVMTYASPVFAHAAQKHYIDYRDLELPTISKYMKDASKRFFDIAGSHPNAFHARRLTINRRIPPTLSVGHETVGLSVSQVIDLSSLLHPAAANRLRPGRREGNRPVTVSCDILCRDDPFQASSIAHVTRRRHSHVPSGRTR